jgi:bile acid-coenzyme A ligase
VADAKASLDAFQKADSCYPAILADSVVRRLRERADAVVLVHAQGDDTEKVTGSTLADAVDAACRELDAVGAPSDAAVVLQMGNVPAFVAALLACWRTGRTVVPMSEHYDADYILSRLAGRIGGRVHLVTASGVEPVPLEVGGDGPRPAGGYVIPTGGSEGNPRMVAVPGEYVERSLRGLASIAATAGWQPGQHQLICGPLDHAASFRFLVLGLRDSGCITLTRTFDAEAVTARMAGIEWTHLTPAQMRAIAATDGFARPGTFHALRGLLHTSARCPRRLKRLWLDTVGAHKVHELYSFTELVGATVISGTEWLRRPGSVGRGFATELRVLDDAGRPLAPRETGKVFLRSGLSRNLMPELRAAGVEVTPSGFCHVGDYGWLDEDGFLTVCGIREDVAPLLGARAYPGLVEDLLLDVPGVRDACVLVETVDGGTELVAYVVTAGPDGLDVASMVKHCRAALPSSMIPRKWRSVPEIPRLASGKLRRERLRSAAVSHA